MRAEAWQDDALRRPWGGRDAEEAEERALQRLNTRLEPRATPTQTAGGSTRSQGNDQDTKPEPVERPKKIDQTGPSSASAPPPLPASSPRSCCGHAPSETPTDPDDWRMSRPPSTWKSTHRLVSRAGAGVLDRAGLEAAMLTRYADLVAYLRQLKLIQANDDASTAPAPIRRGDLLHQGDSMLKQLGWSSDQARAFLQQHLGLTSRQQLSDEQLLQFNMLLEEQTLSASKPG